MKKFFLLIFFSVIFSFTLVAKTGDKMYVMVKNVQVKSGTGYFDSVVGQLQYGNIVSIINEKGNLVEIQSETGKDVRGWINNSTLTSKRIVANSSTSVSASTQEIALAGKGFSQQAESSWKENNNIDYTFVDIMETYEVNNKELLQFIIDGELKGAGR